MSADRIKLIMDSASASQRKEAAGVLTQNKERDATVRKTNVHTTDEVRSWLKKKREEKNSNGEHLIKQAQTEMLQVVVDRVCTDLHEAHADQEDMSERVLQASEPLIWCLHGGSGTGKSFVLKLIKELFIDVLGWVQEIDFQLVALQAVMAEQIGGDTIHHALGINPFGVQTNENKD